MGSARGGINKGCTERTNLWIEPRYCDKMDYLFRDSTYCGVNYGKFDVDRLVSSLTIYVQDDCPRLPISC